MFLDDLLPAVILRFASTIYNILCIFVQVELVSSLVAMVDVRSD
jgi:hypothetical protein